MKQLTFLFIFTALLFHYSSSAQSRITYNELSTAPAPKAIHKLLIMGFGTSATRIFLDKLSSDLIDRCKKKNITIQYGYYGKDTTAIHDLLGSEEVSRYDAVLMLVPSDSVSLNSSLNRTSQTITTQSFGTANFSLAGASFGYSQNFRIQLQNSASPGATSLSASFFVDCNLSNSNAPSKISKKIYASLISHGYL
jgi:hypothetical protein